jgi:hypothetical protein
MINNLVANSNTTREEQHFFIGSTQIPGVQTVDYSYTTNSIPLKFIGMTGNVMSIPAGPENGRVGVGTLLITNDQFIGLTGNQGVNGYIFKDITQTGNNIGFVSGYLTNYNASCAIGQIPQIGANFEVLGNIGRIPSSEASSVVSNFQSIASHVSTLPLKIANPNSIVLSLSDLTTNRTQSFDVNITVPRQANYIIGNRYPVSVSINYPIEARVRFTIDCNDYVFKTLKSFPFNEKRNDISITLKDLEIGDTILTYSFSDMELVGEEYSTDVNGSARATIEYRKFLM